MTETGLKEAGELGGCLMRVTGGGGCTRPLHALPGPSMSSSSQAGFILPAKLLSEAKARVSGSFWARIIPVPQLEI